MAINRAKLVLLTRGWMGTLFEGGNIGSLICKIEDGRQERGDRNRGAWLACGWHVHSTVGK